MQQTHKINRVLLLMSEQTGALDGALDKTLDSNKVNLLT